ncbi:hypothetical protein CJ030_MR8G009796 [Morella rubra]|uniref:Uncharacterized protein n=1 Tax=Morella rubra TaxID=262757 RepID=A0A6A1UQW4_9ROSI|nr:hypothetical protein CJ030_MR8G009796 [Morella rubra]
MTCINASTISSEDPASISRRPPASRRLQLAFSASLSSTALSSQPLFLSLWGSLSLSCQCPPSIAAGPPCSGARAELIGKFLSRLGKEKRTSFIKAWEESEKTKAENK